ncbi:hypothetical protein [Streptomyces sp. NPDC052610]|uniref:hypothetical protein n=1 Tax=Streptomyces sp. NPDC052610 TaxID=3154952 RepID=UPI003435A91A
MTSGTQTHTTGTTSRPARGRHRRPRSRKLLLAAAGLVVAAGLLSLVRPTPEPGAVGGLGAARTGPSPDRATADGGRERAAGTAATFAAAPERSPSAPSALGGVGTAPRAASAGVPVPTATRSPAHTGIGVPRATAVPHAPNPPAAPSSEVTTAPQAPPGTTPPKPKPVPEPAPATGAPAPHRPDDPELCVPVVDLCLDPLSRRR